MKAYLLGIFALFFVALMICMPQVFAQQGVPAFSDVDAIFQSRCVKCHGGTRPPEGLHLDSYNGIIAGAKDGPAIIKGDPAKSKLVKAIKGTWKPRMPKDGPPWLSGNDITLIEKWIEAGAPQ
ncbi:exported hypothetical protein [Syntrophobacter sp. SbD1]|nr:exported hypothetical protein [Syntrophobacter sp. SbD1]